MGKKVSVVIPAYNASNYITNLLTSISQQTFNDFEVLVIDDGSTDETISKVECFRDVLGDKLILKSQKNSGVSKARNLGISLATGDLIVFVDADDVLEKDYLKQMIIPFDQDKSIGVSIIGYYSEYDDGKLKYKTSGDTQHFSYDEAIYNAFILFEYEGYPWNKMYRMDVLKKNKIKFNEHISICEDLLFFVEYTLKVTNVVYNPRPLYHYILHNDSTINGRSVGHRFNKNALSELDAYELMRNEVPNSLKKAQKIMLTRQVWTNSYLSRLIFSAPNFNDSDLIDSYRKMRSYQKKYLVFFLRYAKYNFSHKLFFILNLIFPKLIRCLDKKRSSQR